MKQHIGRGTELKLLEDLVEIQQSSFVAIYGRRRIGKTFLVRTALGKHMSFYMTGMANTSTSQQLVNFSVALQAVDPASEGLGNPATWAEAFERLKKYLETNPASKKVIFLDELPWLDSPRSGFLPALEYFWNSWASNRTDILLVVCGSAASWMIQKLLKSRGGLHNRVTHRIRLQPFTLAECEEFYRSRNIPLDRYQVLLLYMTIGGIPFYMEQVSPGKSADQNIQSLCFNREGLLRTEFENLYHSLFQKADHHVSIVEALAKKSKGLQRNQIIEATGLPNAGSTTRLLTELEEAGFIRKYNQWNKKEQNAVYQLLDPYSLFYIKWIRNADVSDTGFWINSIDSPQRRAWSGYAFELVCLQHAEQIKQALGITGIQSNLSAWQGKDGEQSAQVDLVIDRRDQVINLCEMKFSIHPFVIPKSYAEELRKKIETFKKATGTRKSIFVTFITTFGLEGNAYASSLVQNSFDMDELYR